MDFTQSYQTAIPSGIRAKFDLRETRNAAQILAATNPKEFKEIIGVLKGFQLTEADILTPGGSKGLVAIRLDREFRKLGWREGRHDTEVKSILTVMPYKDAGELEKERTEQVILNEGYKVDNVKGRVALDVEWNAKDGNLDRDVGAYRALYEAGIIDAAVIITRTHEDIRRLAADLQRKNEGSGPPRFNTTTTTNLSKLIPRMSRGDSGGCPLLAIAITDRCFAAEK